MIFRRLLAVSLAVIPITALAASKEILELQRDVGMLQQAVQQLQAAQTEKFATLSAQVQQALDASNRAYTAVAVIQSSLGQTIQEQQKSVVAPVVGVGAKVDQMGGDMRALQQSVSDLTTLIGKLQSQMTDLSNAVRTMQAPPAAPPPSPQGAATGNPPMPATDLYNNALRDRQGGKNDLALQGFVDYLKYYGNTDLAPNAQYYVADIHFSQGDYDSALREFDMVLEKYPDNSKTADAMYMKGRTLMQMGRRTQGADEFKELIKRFPGNELSKKACAQLTGMGLSCGSVPRAAAKKTVRRKR